MIEIIKIDTAFPGYYDEELKEMLADGWKIKDKTLLSERYIHYILEKVEVAPPNTDKE